MIWCCHVLSTSRFQRRLVDSRLTAYGLAHAHFPISELLSLIEKNKWSHKATQRDWAMFDPRSYRLPYQLWQTTPWVEPKKGLFGLFSTTPRRRLRKSAGVTKIFQSFDPTNCYLIGHSQWTIEEYTKFRSGEGRGVRACRNHTSHRRRKEECELKPWYTVQHLRASWDGQLALWTAISKAEDGFTSRLPHTVSDYRKFMQLFRTEFPQPQYQLRPDARPKPRSRLRLVAPTLEVALLWHVHRLFPGSYWPWCDSEVGRLVDSEIVPASEYLVETRRRWENMFPETWPESNELWAGHEAAVLAPDIATKIPMEAVLFGIASQRMKPRPRPKRSNWHGYDAGGSSFGGGDGGSGGGGGDGGGGGGDGGGGGGGGGGDGGGC